MDKFFLDLRVNNIFEKEDECDRTHYYPRVKDEYRNFTVDDTIVGRQYKDIRAFWIDDTSKLLMSIGHHHGTTIRILSLACGQFLDQDLSSIMKRGPIMFGPKVSGVPLIRELIGILKLMPFLEVLKLKEIIFEDPGALTIFTEPALMTSLKEVELNMTLAKVLDFLIAPNVVTLRTSRCYFNHSPRMPMADFLHEAKHLKELHLDVTMFMCGIKKSESFKDMQLLKLQKLTLNFHCYFTATESVLPHVATFLLSQAPSLKELRILELKKIPAMATLLRTIFSSLLLEKLEMDDCEMPTSAIFYKEVAPSKTLESFTYKRYHPFSHCTSKFNILLLLKKLPRIKTFRLSRKEYLDSESLQKELKELEEKRGVKIFFE